MHTYLKREDGIYTVGMWLPDAVGITSFWSMFDVAALSDAILAVNVLNGGDGSGFATVKITKEH